MLLPVQCVIGNFSSIQEAVNIYSDFLPGDLLVVEIEFMRWSAYWQRQSAHTRPDSILAALRAAENLGTFPAV